jgi:hypothetical protein
VRDDPADPPGPGRGTVDVPRVTLHRRRVAAVVV